jgi:hypothetical protein
MFPTALPLSSRTEPVISMPAARIQWNAVRIRTPQCVKGIPPDFFEGTKRVQRFRNQLRAPAHLLPLAQWAGCVGACPDYDDASLSPVPAFGRCAQDQRGAGIKRIAAHAGPRTCPDDDDGAALGLLCAR